jgi:hypothetical protein
MADSVKVATLCDMGHYLAMFLKIILIFISSFLALGHEVYLLGRLSPIGIFEVYSDKLYGDLFYFKKDKSIKSRKLSVRTNSLETGIDLRDEHLHKYLNYEKYPRIFIKDILISNSKGTGTIFINGVSKNINFIMTSDKDHYISKFSLIPSMFKIKPASFMGVSIKDKVELTIKVLKKEIVPK